VDDDAGGDTWSDDVGGRIMVNSWVLLVDTLPTPGLEQQPIRVTALPPVRNTVRPSI
jgi:hypothetical protein